VVSRRHVIFGAGGVLVAAGLAGLLVAGLGRTPSGKNPATATGFEPQWSSLQRGLTAPAIATEADTLAVELRAHFVRRGRPLLPAGSHLLISPATFHALSPRLATVDAVVTGAAPGHWQLVLIRETGRWLVLGTRKLP
jgi:hypothetical protein